MAVSQPLTVFGIVFGASLFASAAPVVVPHSGLLLDASDVPVEATALPVRFAVYSASAGGNPLWASQTCFVSVRAGRFATTIGDACTGPVPLDESVIPPGSVRWIDLTVDGVALSPRVQLSSVPSASVSLRSLDTEALRTNLASAGTLNAAENPVDWTQLKGVPADVAAGGNYAAGAGLQLSGKQFSVASGGIVDGMLAGAISGQKLVAGSVGSAQLADGSITLSKLAPGLLNGIGKLNADTLDGFDSSAFAPAGVEGKVDAVSAKIGDTGAQSLVDRITALASSGGSTAALAALAADIVVIKADTAQIRSDVRSLNMGQSSGNAGTTCREIQASPGNRGSGIYWIDPDGSGPEAPYQTRCDMDLYGGGWTLALNLNTSDSTTRDWSDTGFWQGNAAVGSVETALATDFKSPTFWRYSTGTQLMFVVHRLGAVKGSAMYDFLNVAQNKSLHWMFNNLSNTTITGGRLANTGSVGSAGARCAGDIFVDNAQAVIINSTYSPVDSVNVTRIGTDYSGVCGTINCNGHNYGGWGGRHYRAAGPWGTYYEGAQPSGYCNSYGGYGSNGRGYNGSNAFSGDCSGSGPTIAADLAVYVR